MCRGRTSTSEPIPDFRTCALHLGLEKSHTSDHHSSTSGNSRLLSSEVQPQGLCQQVQKYPTMLSNEEPRRREKNSLRASVSPPQPGLVSQTFTTVTHSHSGRSPLKCSNAEVYRKSSCPFSPPPQAILPKSFPKILPKSAKLHFPREQMYVIIQL